MLVDLSFLDYCTHPFAGDKIDGSGIWDRFLSFLIESGERRESFHDWIIGTRGIKLKRAEDERSKVTHMSIAIIQNIKERRGFTFIQLICQVHQRTDPLSRNLFEDAASHLFLWDGCIQEDLGDFFEQPSALLVRLLL